jgi:hypothetical protein
LNQGEVRLKSFGIAVALAGFLSLPSSFAHAQTVGGAEQAQLPAVEKLKTNNGKSADDWRFALSVYGWATNLSGSATARGNTVNINASVIDLFQKSDSLAAWDSYFEADKGRFGLYADFVWARLGVPLSAAAYANPIAGVKLSAQANAAVTLSLTVIEGGGLYELAKWQGDEQSFTALDGFVGGRFWNISTQVALDITGALDFSDPRLSRFDRTRTINLADSGSVSWVDPLIGLRLRHQFTPSQQVALRGDIGGFGIAGSSSFSWQLAAIYSYTWQFDGYALAAIGGYRALSVNKNFGGSGDNLNLLIHGPIVGLTVKF